MTVTWTGTSGDWNTPSLWSGTIVPTSADNVSIEAANGTVTISAGESVVAATLTLDGGNLFNSGPTLDLIAGGTLNVAGSVVLGGAEIDLAGVLQGTLTARPPPPPGAIITPLPKTGTLVTAGGTLIGAMDLLAGEDIVVSGTGLNLLSALGTAGTITDDGVLEFDGTQTLNNVIIAVSGDLGGDGVLVAGNRFSPGFPASSLTLGPNVLVTVSGGVLGVNVNQGVVDVVNPAIVNQNLDSLDASFINEGTVDAASFTRVNLTGGTAPINAATGLILAETSASVTLTLSNGSLFNTGTIILAAGAEVTFNGTNDLTGSNPFVDFGTVINNGGTVDLGGTLLNAGHTLALSTLASHFGSVALSGTIVGGTVIDDTASVSAGNVTLQDAVWNGTIVGTQGTVALLGSVAFHGADGTGQGSIDLTAPYSSLAVWGSLANVQLTLGNATIPEENIIAGTLGPTVTLTSTAPGAQVAIDGQIGIYVYNSVGLVNEGLIDAAAPGGSFVVAGTFTNAGTVTVENGDLFSIFSSANSTSGAYRLATGGKLEGAVAPGNTVYFTDATNSMLKLKPLGQQGVANSVPIVAGFRAGNQIDLVPYAITPSGSYAASFVSGSIDVTLNGTALVDIPVAPGEDYTGDRFAFQSDGGNGVLMDIASFLPGTLIRTDKGEVAVEALKTGDTVMTLHGHRRKLCWIGRGKALATRGRRGAATPIIVRKGALDDNIPHSDLRITKGHALYFDGVLIPAEFLVNHRSIHWDDRAQEVTVFHLELDAHDVLVANGAAAESYRDDANRWLFQNANTGWDQPPKPPFAPVLTGGAVVDAVWQRLLDRSGPRSGLPLTREPDLSLLVDGVRVDATTQTDDVYVFKLPGIPDEVRIVTRAAVPQEMGLARDPRCLGVAVRRIAVRKHTHFQVVGAADADLTDGFYPFEAETGLRWTNGDAAIPNSMFDGIRGPGEVVVHLSATAHYIDDGEVAAVA